MISMSCEEMLALLRDQRNRFPADAAALDRVSALFGLPPLEEPQAAALPRLSLPLRIQPAKASALGWSTELFALTLVVGNAVEHGGELRGHGPVVAVCAEYGRPLVALDPPAPAQITLDRARTDGVPTLRLPGGWFRKPSLRLEETPHAARAPSSRAFALARATRFLDDLSEAWRRPMTALEVAWPVYRAERNGAPLDAVSGTPLPELELR